VPGGARLAPASTLSQTASASSLALIPILGDQHHSVGCRARTFVIADALGEGPPSLASVMVVLQVVGSVGSLTPEIDAVEAAERVSRNSGFVVVIDGPSPGRRHRAANHKTVGRRRDPRLMSSGCQESGGAAPVISHPCGDEFVKRLCRSWSLPSATATQCAGGFEVTFLADDGIHRPPRTEVWSSGEPSSFSRAALARRGGLRSSAHRAGHLTKPLGSPSAGLADMEIDLLAVIVILAADQDRDPVLLRREAAQRPSVVSLPS